MANPSSRARNSTINIATGFGSQFLVALLRFVTRTVFIYTLGKEYLGISGYFTDILSMLSLTELGLDTAINFKLYKPLAEGDDKRVRMLMKFYRQAYQVIGASIFLIGLCLIPFLPRLIKDYDNLAKLNINAALIFLLYLLKSASSYLFFAYRSAVVKANQKRYLLDIAGYGMTILMNVVQIAVLCWFRDYLLYTAVAIIVTVLTNFINAVIAKHYYPQFFIPEPDSLSREEVLGLFKDCGALFLFKVNAVVLKATDNMVLGYFIGLVMVGLYSNYLILYTTLRNFLDKFYAAIRASVGNLFAVSDIPTKYRFFETMNYLTVILYGTAAAGLAVCANELIHAWIGTDYVVAQPLAILVGIEILFYGLKSNLGQIRTVSGLFRQMWYRPVIGAATNVILSVIFVQFWGISGVILGTICSDILSNFALDPKIIYKHGFNNYQPVWKYYRKNLIYFMVLAAVCAADMWICGTVFTGHGWFSVIVHSMIVAVTVPAVFVLLFWKTRECQYLAQLAGRIVRNVKTKFAG
jgi:O-antigen/teichoic acid export membrane protein